MSTYEILRTDTADSQLHQIILHIAESWGADVALEKLDEMEHQIMALEENPYIGSEPRYRILRRQGYKVLILEKNLVFYKIDDENKKVTIYAIVDQRQDYLNIVRGL